ncbi:MAG: peptidylprolyl isomerase [Defluviimonas sp.]|uniref:peptidylprolyl isomerase n=1 Tax=Albidovulum sp. TaxID=1872424 RepID=UPI001D715173|nr:peptidylprolyl isomerase [Paracoccaceae bacterium]MCC0063996.1 peptidylprolyl isomerase [Defluviimonas sp.]
MTKLRALTLIVPLAFLAAVAPATAQTGRFAPAITVNDEVVTRYELEQRKRFLTVLRIPGDIEQMAETGLIEDRLRLQAAKAMGLTLTDEQLTAGMAEFAGRANLETEQFLTAIGQAGVEPETFRDFVRAGLLWRDVVRTRFAPKISISEAEIDRALSVPAQRGAGPRVLLSEILIPFGPANAPEARRTAEELSRSLRSEAAFAAAARQYSAAASRDQGGQIGWIPLTNLPPQARSAVAALANGQVSEPVPLGKAIGLFRLRGIQQGGEINPRDISVDYAQYLIPGGQAATAEAERVRGEVDTCDDLYRIARKQPADRLIRETRPQGALPADIARAIAPLDDNESTTLNRGGTLVFVMLCKRSATAGSIQGGALAAAVPLDGAPAIDPDLGFGKGPGRAQVREELVNQRLGGLAEGYMASLKANAMIARP